MIVFDVSNVSIFLEPGVRKPMLPWQIAINSDRSPDLPAVSPADIPHNFYSDADRRLGLATRLQLYVHLQQPSVQFIERIDDSVFAETIAGNAHSKTGGTAVIRFSRLSNRAHTDSYSNRGVSSITCI